MLITKYILKYMQMSRLAFEKKVVIQTDENVLNGFHLFLFTFIHFFGQRRERGLFINAMFRGRQMPIRKKSPVFLFQWGFNFYK